MNFRVEPSTAHLFSERAAWRYPPPYDFYDDDGIPPNNPERFYSVRAEDGRVAGFSTSRTAGTRSSTALDCAPI